MLVSFLGRSTEGILRDARKAFPGEQILLVSRDNDAIQPPADVSCISVSEFEPDLDKSYTVISNGGTAVQLIPVVMRLVRAGVDMRIFDLQIDSIERIDI